MTFLLANLAHCTVTDSVMDIYDIQSLQFMTSSWSEGTKLYHAVKDVYDIPALYDMIMHHVVLLIMVVADVCFVSLGHPTNSCSMVDAACKAMQGRVCKAVGAPHALTAHPLHCMQRPSYNMPPTRKACVGCVRELQSHASVVGT